MAVVLGRRRPDVVARVASWLRARLGVVAGAVVVAGVGRTVGPGGWSAVVGTVAVAVAAAVAVVGARRGGWGRVVLRAC